MGRESLLLAGMAISGAYLLRLALILGGLLKSPVLRRFERYSALEADVYYPLPFLAAGSGLFVLCLGTFMGRLAGSDFPAHMPGIALLALAYGLARMVPLAKRFPGVFLGVPRWYAELNQRTTREERRRIAYMWLALPRRARQHYEWDTHAFTLWVDLVIVSTANTPFEDVMRMMMKARR